MGGFEDDEPPAKRARASSVESAGLSDSFCFSKSINPLGGTMARPLPSQGKEVMVGSKGVIKRDEFVRIITKALYTLGYEKSGAVLEEESGITLHSPAVNLFRKQVLDGNWDNAVATLNKIGFLDENIVKSAAFFILEQKFFELLRNDNLMGAIKTLQSEITPLDVNRKRVHELSSCVLSSPQNVLLGFSKLGIESSNSRLKLLEELQKVLPPTVMVPERRLENLVEQALTVQREACYFHNSVDGLSLYTDHHCGKDQIPSQTLQVLCAHSDEVWFLQFSNNGKYLASASNDKSAIIWKVDENGELLLKHTLTGHEKPVMMVAWSPDDRQLLTCGMEEAIRRWDVESGECILVYEKPSLGLISCGWFPDGKQILSVLKDQNFCLWDLDGKEVDCWKGQRSKTSDFAVANDGKLIISTSTNRECTILLFDRETKQERLIEEECTITSFSLSEDGDFLLVNLTSQEIHLWNIRNSPIRVKRYTGHKRNRFVIRSCFGGSEQAFIASGSEDSQVYIWHRATGELIEALPGHSGTVNCVSWNPTNPHMLASASDDHTIRIWGVEKASPKLKDIGGGSSNGVHMNGSAHGNGFVHQCNGNRIK